MPSVSSWTPIRGNGSLTSVTSTYAVLPMNATSIAPPSGITCGGSQLANVVTVPVSGSTREIRPAAGSGTYNAPSGPTVLPEPPCRPVTQPGVTVGAAVGGAALAESAATNPVNTVSVPANAMRNRLRISVSPLSGRDHGRVGPHDHGVGHLHDLVDWQVGLLGVEADRLRARRLVDADRPDRPVLLGRDIAANPPDIVRYALADGGRAFGCLTQVVRCRPA